MDSGMLSALSGIRSALDSHAVRAQNVANVNTRDYRAKQAIQSEGAQGEPEIKVREKDAPVVEETTSGQVSHSAENRQSKVAHSPDGDRYIPSNSQDENQSLNEDNFQGLEVVRDGTVYLKPTDEDQNRVKVGKLISGGERVENTGSTSENKALDQNNVALEEELTGQILDEKALAANVKVIQTRDKMLGDLLDLTG